jgi:phage tail tube protein FII
MAAGNTEVGATKQDIIAAAVQAELKERSFLTNWVLDVSSFAGKGMKSISFPKLTSFTVEERATATAGTIQNLTASVDKLDLDKRAYISWLIDSNDAIQSTIDYQVEAALYASRAHARFVDDKLIQEALNVASLNVNSGTPADIGRDEILEMRRYLMENNANMQDVVLVIPPSQEEALLKVNEFSRADIYGQAIIPSGVIGRVYGIPVLIHNSSELDEQQALMFEKSGLAIGFQRMPSFDEQKEIAFGTGAMRQALDQLFGVKGLQLGVSTSKHTVASGKSALVAKLAD